MIELSVIMPIYNAEKTLRRAIESMIGQTYQDWELILIDDGSTDASSKICDEYAEKYDKVSVTHQENFGVSIARNNGLKKASGIYIAFLDSDDYIDSSTYEKMMIDARTSRADMVMCGYYREFYEDNVLKVTQTINANNIQIQSIESFLQNFNELYQKNYINVIWNKLYKKEIIMLNNIEFQSNVSIGEDLIFNIDYLKQSINIYINNQPLYHYVNNNKCITLSKVVDNYTFLNITAQYLYVRKFIYDELESDHLLIDADIFIKNIFFTLEQYTITSEYNKYDFRIILKELLKNDTLIEACKRSSSHKLELRLYRQAIKLRSITVIRFIIYIRRYLKQVIRFRSFHTLKGVE